MTVAVKNGIFPENNAFFFKNGGKTFFFKNF